MIDPEAWRDAHAELQRLRALAENVPALLAYYERQHYLCVYANRRYAETFGRDTQSILGLSVAQVIGEQAAELIQPQVDLVIAQGRTVSYVRELNQSHQSTQGSSRISSPPRRADEVPRRPGGDIKDRQWIEVSLVPHWDDAGEVTGAFVLINDITAHRRAELALRESEERLAKFMDASVEGIAFHKGGFITDVNAPMAALLGLTPEQMRGRFVLDFIAPEHLQSMRQRLDASAVDEAPQEAAVIHRDGRSIAVEIIARRTQRGGEELRLVVVRDVRDRLAARERIHYLALHDALTGLQNRGAFMDELAARLTQARALGSALALMFLDLDHFKRINDALGHLAGDAVLSGVAERISARLPAEAVAGRFGGDEFVILLTGAVERAQVQALAERVRAAASSALAYGEHSLQVTPTIGIALCPDHGDDPDSLLRCADAALYTGKERGRDGIVFYEPGMGAATRSEILRLKSRQ